MMKKLCGILAVTLVLLTGCATRTPSPSDISSDTPNTTTVFSDNNQTPYFSIENYKSPELRSMQQRKNVSVAVAISGGGHRAGNFGIGVLKELENIHCNEQTFNVLNEADYFSTVSGGGMAAGVYISTLHDHIHGNGDEEYSLSRIIDGNKDEITRNLERGYHNILTTALVNLKSLGNNDRGDFLEEEFDSNLLGSQKRGRSLTLGDVFTSKDTDQNPVVPLWVANATVYENGSIFPFHPDALKQYEIVKYTHHLEKYDLNGDYFSMPLSIGLKASASFPGAVPATTLESTHDSKNAYLHLFDGGLSDNLGVYSALDMLTETGENEKVLIVIDAYNVQPEPFSKQEGSPTILQIFLRTTGISLDAWRIRHKLLIEKLSSSSEYNGTNVEVIYLSFDDLSGAKKKEVSDIGTNFNITGTDQKALFDAAQITVEKNKTRLVDAIYGESCG